MHNPLGLRIGGARLPVDEAKEPLAGGPEEVVAAIVRCFVQRGHVGRTLQHRSQGLTRVRAEVHNRLAGVEALDKQQVGVGLQELSGRRRRGCDVDAEHPITRVGVVDDVERTVTGGHDRSVVDDRRSGNLNKRAVSRAGHGTRLELGEREAVGSWHRDTGGTEIRCALEVDQRLPKGILRRRWGVESHRLHTGGAADTHVCAYQSEKSMLHFISLLVLVVLAVLSKQKMYRSGSTRTPKSTMSKDDREHSAFK